MREPDFVYGIVPDLGEYGFEVQPSTADTSVVTRVQKLAASVEWTGLVPANSVAIALDPGNPNLVARFATDPRDPDGRISLSLKVWIENDEFVAASLVDELWPKQGMSVSKRQFMESSGRRICGPENSFGASGFEFAWGHQSTKRTIATSRPQGSRPSATKGPRGSNASSIALKAFATMMTLLCFGLSGLCVYLYQENDRNNQEAVRYAGQRDTAVDRLKEVQDSFDQQSQEHAKEANSLREKTVSLETEAASKDAVVSRLKKVIQSDPDKVDQGELEELRDFRQIVQENVEAWQASIDRINNALPKERTWLSDPVGKFKESLPRTSNNE